MFRARPLYHQGTRACLLDRLVLIRKNGERVAFFTRNSAMDQFSFFLLPQLVQVFLDNDSFEGHEVVTRTCKDGMLALALLTFNCLVLVKNVGRAIFQEAVILIILIAQPQLIYEILVGELVHDGVIF